MEKEIKKIRLLLQFFIIVWCRSQWQDDDKIVKEIKKLLDWTD